MTRGLLLPRLDHFTHSLFLSYWCSLARSKLLLAIDSIVGGGEEFMEFMEFMALGQVKARPRGGANKEQASLPRKVGSGFIYLTLGMHCDHRLQDVAKTSLLVDTKH